MRRALGEVVYLHAHKSTNRDEHSSRLYALCGPCYKALRTNAGQACSAAVSLIVEVSPSIQRQRLALAVLEKEQT